MPPLRGVAFLSLAIAAAAHAGVRFGPPNVAAGQRIRMVARTVSADATVETRSPEANTRAAMDYRREREVVWTLQQPAPDGAPRLMVRIPRFVTVSTLVVNNRPDVRTRISPLTDKLLAATRDKEGKWVFTTDGRVLGPRDEEVVEELAAYQDRAWFPDHEVQVGQSWEFDPRWIKLVVQRDLRDALAVGTMTLREIRRTRTAQTAVLDVAVHSSGTTTTAAYRETSATVDLKGRAVVNLLTMLDESLEIGGVVHSETSDGSRRTIVNLPLQLTVTKKLEPGAATP